MKIGLFGGSFDPFHEGHLTTALNLLQYLDKIIFIPTYQNPLKQHRPMFNNEERLELIKQVCKYFPEFDYSDYDIVTENCFTINTVRHLSNLYHDADLYWILGDDAFTKLHRWKDWKSLFDYVKLIVVERNQPLAHTLRYADNICRQLNLEFSLGWSEKFPLILIYDVETPSISSTQIRKQLNNKLDYLKQFESIVRRYHEHTKEKASSK